MEHHEALRVELAAGLITKGVRVVLPDGTLSALVEAVVTEDDDLGNPLLNRLMLDDGAALRVALTATVRVVAGAGAGIIAGGASDGQEDAGAPSAGSPVEPHTENRAENPAGSPADRLAAAPLGGATDGSPDGTGPGSPAPTPFPSPTAPAPRPEDPAVVAARERIPALPDTPEQLIRDVAERYPGRGSLQNLADRLVKGINVKSGSCLADLRAFAQDLFLEYQDPQASLEVADLLNVLPFDANPARWSHTEASLALSSFVAEQLGEPQRAAAYRVLLRAPEDQELDPFRSRLEAKIRQRRLNEPNLYDTEIFRAMDSGNHEAEREWRVLRVESLLHLLAHGGSQTLSRDEVERRVRQELELIRA
ncbi:DUF6707 family protein [Arthrobacter sp. RAF14]|uniref:DUF6707 family protein n=1 Tax=Arthrobacter sp. RAF14 TaxID=3233051 RepID=UPI003F8EEFE1